jgi:uncharacterized protein (TIGR03086 family)
MPPHHVGGGPARAYRESASRLLDAFAIPGILEESVDMPIGTVPGILALQLRVVETLVHGWDLAQATNQRAEFPEAIAEGALAFTRQTLSLVPQGRTPFAPPQPVTEQSPAISRLAGLLGRPVTQASPAL